jgi:hypothetical protein
MCTKLCVEILKERNHLEDVGVNGRIGKEGCSSWIGFVWFGIGTDGGLL